MLENEATTPLIQGYPVGCRELQLPAFLISWRAALYMLSRSVLFKVPSANINSYMKIYKTFRNKQEKLCINNFLLQRDLERNPRKTERKLYEAEGCGSNEPPD